MGKKLHSGIYYRKYFSRFIVYLMLSFFALTAIVPFVFSFSTSVKSESEYYHNKTGFPEEPTLDNFRFVLFDAGLLRFLGNTIILVSAGLFLYLLICSAAGFAFGKLSFSFRLPIFLAVLFLMIFPQMVVSVQVYRICSNLKLLNTHIGVILVWVAYFAPFGTYIMTTYFSNVPKVLVDSAKIDGANVWQLLFRIMLPIATPMLATLAVIGTIAMWNEFPFSLLLLQKPDMRTITLGIAMMQGEHGLSVPALTTAVTISAIVPLILFIFFQKYISMGATAGSVKG